MGKGMGGEGRGGEEGPDGEGGGPRGKGEEKGRKEERQRAKEGAESWGDLKEIPRGKSHHIYNGFIYLRQATQP